MSAPTQYDLQGLMPAFAPHLAVSRVVNLPFGGPTGTGGAWTQGQLLGAAAFAAQSEVATLTVSGTAAHSVSFIADKPYIVSHAYNATLAAVKALWEAVFGTGNVAVTGTPGTTYVLTFQGLLANQRIGGLFTAAASGGTPTWARTTRGSCGVAQYDVYSQADNNDVDALLQYALTSSPQGARVTEFGTAEGQPYQPPAFTAGIFKAADITGLDTNAYTLGKLVKKAGGTYVQLV